jgi:chromosome segregation ATPase
MESLKKEFLDLLEKDLEFRYAIAGYLGLLEILKRLDALSEEQVKLREDFNELREDFKELREEQIKLREDFNELRKEQIKLREEQTRLREDFNRMFKAFDKRMSRIERTLEKLTLDIEDEAKEVIEGRLSRMGFDIKLERLELPDLELNLYGANGNLCVIGEATVRLGLKEVEKLARAVDKLINERPDLLRPKKILVLYTSLATEIALKEAEKEGIWVLKATKDLTKPPKLKAT